MSQIIPLWHQDAPGAVGIETQDTPTLEIFLTCNASNGRAVVVCPGGGYGFLADDHEGRQVAEWLNERGIAAFVLRYRVAPRYAATFLDGVPVQLLDARRALRVVRARANEWQIDPGKIGIWGFSAGGHLAALASTRFEEGKDTETDFIERVSSRPDFSVLAYPVITLENDFTHQGSRESLLGQKPNTQKVREYSPQMNVTSETPPAFLFHTADDDAVPYQNSVLYFEALKRQGIDAALHIFPRGYHGVGLAPEDEELKWWPLLLENWLSRFR